MIRAQRHPPKAVAIDTGNPVEAGESFVDEGVVRAQQLEQAPVLPDRALDEQLGFAPKRVPQVLVELGIVGRLPLLRVEVSKPQPLADEVVDQGA